MVVTRLLFSYFFFNFRHAEAVLHGDIDSLRLADDDLHVGHHGGLQLFAHPPSDAVLSGRLRYVLYQPTNQSINQTLCIRGQGTKNMTLKLTLGVSKFWWYWTLQSEAHRQCLVIFRVSLPLVLSLCAWEYKWMFFRRVFSPDKKLLHNGDFTAVRDKNTRLYEWCTMRRKRWVLRLSPTFHSDCPPCRLDRFASWRNNVEHQISAKFWLGGKQIRSRAGWGVNGPLQWLRKMQSPIWSVQHPSIFYRQYTPSMQVYAKSIIQEESGNANLLGIIAGEARGIAIYLFDRLKVGGCKFVRRIFILHASRNIIIKRKDRNRHMDRIKTFTDALKKYR